LADLDERIRLAERAEELMAEVSRLAGEYFGASRCYFAEVFEGEDRWTISRDYHVGRPSIAGEYPVSAFPPGALRRLGKGRTLVSGDTKNDPRSAPHFETGYAPIGVRAHVIAPLVREGRWVAALAITTDDTRHWQSREIMLLETVAER